MPYWQETTFADRACAGFGIFQMRAVAAMAGILILAGCSGTNTQAPIIDGIGAMSQSALPFQVKYVVKPNDTLYSITRTANIDLKTLKRLNNLPDPNQLVVGQVLLLTAVGTDSLVAGDQHKPSDSIVGARSDVRLAASTSESHPSRASTLAASPGDGPIAIRGDWPIKGPLIQHFDAKTMGIDIKGRLGDPIHAAADGEVKYTGNGVRGLGSLIILSHTNGFITVYAHNSKLLVKTGQHVKRDDKIAEMGQTDTTSPRLHFEVRHRGTPIDPLRYLLAP